MSASTLAKSNPAIHVLAPDSQQTTVVLQAIPKNTVLKPSEPPLDYFNQSNRYVPDVLQERAALERIAHAFSTKSVDEC